MTPAEELRTAAEKLRGRAADATPGPWDSMAHSHMKDGCRCLSCWQATGWLFTHTQPCEETDAAEHLKDAADCPVDVMSFEDAEYTITVHPGVGAALALLLEQSAEAFAGQDVPIDEPALAVARQILRSQP